MGNGWEMEALPFFGFFYISIFGYLKSHFFLGSESWRIGRGRGRSNEDCDVKEKPKNMLISQRKRGGRQMDPYGHLPQFHPYIHS